MNDGIAYIYNIETKRIFVFTLFKQSFKWYDIRLYTRKLNQIDPEDGRLRFTIWFAARRENAVEEYNSSEDSKGLINKSYCVMVGRK